MKEDCIFTYRAVTFYGRTFQTVRLTLSFSRSNLVTDHSVSRPICHEIIVVLQPQALLLGSPGLGSSDFARHYFRNHGCFLFLQVLRWFTSLGSLPVTMDSSRDNRCSQRLGFPIRKSPDHSVLATPRGLSQLAASFIAYLRQGIHTHALSSLTIKFTLNTDVQARYLCAPHSPVPGLVKPCIARQYSIVKELRFLNCLQKPESARTLRVLRFLISECWLLVSAEGLARRTGDWWAWVDLNYRPHPYQGCALAT